MPINYMSLGRGKRLSEIVMAGSHDAGIMAGKANAQTQSMNILQQATCGVRLFDLRIAAFASRVSGLGKEVELKAYHADGLMESTATKKRTLVGIHRAGAGRVERTKLRGFGRLQGAVGNGLVTMLQHARTFVTDICPAEFLLLKFDKSYNWPAIARTCVDELGGAMYNAPGNLNMRTLDDLAGSVVVLFTPPGLQAIGGGWEQHGVMGIRNLHSSDGPPAVYDPNYNGLTYFGKGGTTVNPFKWSKIKINRKKQEKLMKAMAAQAGDQNRDVMGMMYWTSTGLVRSIKSRNDKQWSDANVTKLKALWESGLKESITARLNHHVDVGTYANGPVLQAFMPNFVMIDFADPKKCETIFELNNTAATELTAAARQHDLETFRTGNQRQRYGLSRDP